MIQLIFLLLEAISLCLEFIFNSYVAEEGLDVSFEGLPISQVYILTVLGRWFSEGRLILPFLMPQSIQFSAYLISGSPFPSISIQCEVVIFILYLFDFFSSVLTPNQSLLLNLSIFFISLSSLLLVTSVLLLDSILCPFLQSPLSLQQMLSFDFSCILSICFKSQFLFSSLDLYFLDVSFIFASQFYRDQRYQFYSRMAVLSVWIYSGRKSIYYSAWGFAYQVLRWCQWVLLQSFVSTFFIYSIFFMFFYFRFCFVCGPQIFPGDRESYFFFVAC